MYPSPIKIPPPHNIPVYIPYQKRYYIVSRYYVMHSMIDRVSIRGGADMDCLRAFSGRLGPFDCIL